jgi:hypothetical protein
MCDCEWNVRTANCGSKCVQNIETVGVHKRNKMFCCCTTTPDHTSVRKPRRRSQKFGWTTLPHPPYIPDVAPSYYHLFGKLKESLRGTRFEDGDALITATKRSLRRAGPEFCRAGIQGLVPRRRKAVERDEDYVKKWYFVPKGCINILYK